MILLKWAYEKVFPNLGICGLYVNSLTHLIPQTFFLIFFGKCYTFFSKYFIKYLIRPKLLLYI